MAVESLVLAPFFLAHTKASTAEETWGPHWMRPRARRPAAVLSPARPSPSLLANWRLAPSIAVVCEPCHASGARRCNLEGPLPPSGGLLPHGRSLTHNPHPLTHPAGRPAVPVLQVTGAKAPESSPGGRRSLQRATPPGLLCGRQRRAAYAPRMAAPACCLQPQAGRQAVGAGAREPSRLGAYSIAWSRP